MDITTTIVDGVKFARLYVSPITGNNVSTSSERVFWQDADGCNGNIFIGDDATCYCEKCNKRSHIRNIKVLSDSTSSTESNEGNKLGIQPTVSNCTAMAGEMVKECGRLWLKSFLDGLSKYTPNSEDVMVIRPYKKEG